MVLTADTLIPTSCIKSIHHSVDYPPKKIIKKD